MTRNPSPERRESPRSPARTGMRLIVPLQGVVQGRGGLILGSVIPCALFYFLQFYLKRHRPPPSDSPSRSPSAANLAELPRSSSRANLLARGSSGRASLSSRAAAVAKPNDSPYYIGLDRAREDPYDEIKNPDGVFQLGLSENRLSLDLIEEWFSQNSTASELELGSRARALGLSGIATYQPMDGLMEFKVAMADFMAEVMGRTLSFDPSHVILTCGATAALEILTFCLADQGNAFLVPAPYYPGFDRDIRWRTGVELIPVHCRSCENFTLSITSLEQTFNQARKRGQKIRGILLTNPSNPIGNLFSRDTLYDLLDFARERNIHIICDEIFAGSTYGDEQFVSMAEIIESEDADKDRVHIVYSLSKDFCIPGSLKVGVIYSKNENVLAACKKLTRLSSLSGPTQRILMPMLSDKRFIREFLKENRKRLLECYDLFVVGLREMGLECMRSSAGLYCWVDMSRLISPYNEKGELDLWEKLLNTAKVNVTPGSTCHCIEPGWFRFCFTTLSENEIPVVMGRIRRVVERCKLSV
ncbi:1-aminocyclopropane-1-carboxylate synthase [Striga asiatica]|uniref:1-aminocyclopropane-1-carboxylate synthase n=1 Tax=Striga asiatica TaxID=4170 RepID=A0A5A7QS04_STRAF|nr:1-aminocyclopropane-1-carboxylate synthase [Striga asiatica]